jgi:hypothetical protein
MSVIMYAPAIALMPSSAGDMVTFAPSPGEDPGYAATAVMLGEAGLYLAAFTERLRKARPP